MLYYVTIRRGTNKPEQEQTFMSNEEIRIVELPPMRVASLHGFGPQPEEQAWQRLTQYAGAKGFLENIKEHRIFGFNNPSPSSGSPNYGYEYWIKVGPEATAEADVEIKEFSGGLYAVLRCEVHGDAYQSIPSAWERLVLWLEHSRYKKANYQWLEEHLEVEQLAEGEFVLDLYLPISE
jgi:DNA gyrase inhibitor GyrI